MSDETTPRKLTNYFSRNSSEMRSDFQALNREISANVKGGMADAQYGMVGLLRFLQVAPTFGKLALDEQLKYLEEEVNTSTVELPSINPSLSPFEIEYPVPREYRFQHTKIANKITFRFDTMDEATQRTLLQIFHTHCKDELQLVVAKELYERNWRFHTKWQRWLKYAMNRETLQGETSQTGYFFIYEPISNSINVIYVKVNYKDFEIFPSQYQISCRNIKARVIPNSSFQPEEPITREYRSGEK